MSRKQLVPVMIVVAIAVLVGVLALRNRQPPLLPDDPDHARFLGAEACLACHGPEAGAPKGRNHPVGNDCLRCHGGR